LTQILDLSNNAIDDVPGEIGRIESLNKLVLDGNMSCVDVLIIRCSTVPYRVSVQRDLTGSAVVRLHLWIMIRMIGNFLRRFKRQVLAQGIVETKKYLLSKLDPSMCARGADVSVPVCSSRVESDMMLAMIMHHLHVYRFCQG